MKPSRCAKSRRSVVKLLPFLNFAVGKNKRHSGIASKKRAVPVESVVKVLSPKPVETNT